MREVEIIAPKKYRKIRLLNVAAYARVSDAKDAMLNSLAAQVAYYTTYIKSTHGWSFAGVYTDKGITGTKAARPEFQRLLADAKAGKIDKIITKSVSRFARNTVDLLDTVRSLKELNIDVFFQKENIHTLSGEGEVMLTILASFAQEESKSVSDNCKWRIRNGFKEGKINALTMLGYRRNADGSFAIVPTEAETIKCIFDLYLKGKGMPSIAKYLQGNQVPSRCGRPWNPSTIKSILSNEKVMGSIVLQKTYRIDHLSKKKSVNGGALPKYVVANHHEPIISSDTFARVQDEIERRKGKLTPKRGTFSSFTGKIKCGCCGKNYMRKTVGPPENHVWICATYNKKGKRYCQESKRIPEQVLLAESAKVLGLKEFGAEVFAEKVEKIMVPEANKLEFHLKNDTVINIGWLDRSRSKSWTDEMKEKARRKRLCTKDRK